MKILTIIVGSFLLTSMSLRAQDEEKVDKSGLVQKEMRRYQNSLYQFPADERIDAKYYKLDVRVFTSPSSNFLKGVVTMTAMSKQANLTTMRLDLMNSMTVDSVVMNGLHVGYAQHADYFDIILDRAYNNNEFVNLKVYYQGVPGSSGFGSFEYVTHGGGIPWIYTLSEPYGAKDWWPCKDHPSDKADSVDINITVDAAYKAGSNGKLVAIISNGDGTKTYQWHEKYPIATYLVSVTFSDFAEFTNWWHYTPTDSMPILNYVLPEHLTTAQTQFALVPQMLSIFSSIYGMYPFVDEKYGHCEFGWGGAMEHQTMTSITYSFDEFTTAHELAHQWFGDLITCRTWPDLWLNEGFATYSEALYREAKYGANSYWAKMNGAMNSAKNALGTLHVQDTSNVNNLFASSRVYNKGASVLHMLRHVVGDSVFFHAMKNYAATPTLRFNTASSTDFKNVFELTSGKDLDYFFDEWVYGERYPNYQYWWRSKAAFGGGYDVTLGVQQTTGTTNPGFFTMPIDFKFKAAGWDTTIIAFNDQSSQTFVVRVSHQPTSVLLDSAGWILKTATQITAPVEQAQIVIGALGLKVLPIKDYLQVYVATREKLKTDTISFVLNNNTVDKSHTLSDLGSNVYYTEYELSAAGTLDIIVTGTDSSDNFVYETKRYTIASVSKDLALSLKTDGIEFTGAKGIVKENGFILVSRTTARDETSTLLSNALQKNSEQITTNNAEWIQVGKSIELLSTVKLAKVLSVKIMYAEEELNEVRVRYPNFDERKVGVYREDAGQWIYEGGEGRAHTITAKLEKTGSLALFYDPTHEFIPTRTDLLQNYPNPFNPNTTIKFGLPDEGKVTLVIYNVLGQKVRELINDSREAGYQTVVWNGKNELGQEVASGLYVYRLETSSGVQSKKMLLIK